MGTDLGKGMSKEASPYPISHNLTVEKQNMDINGQSCGWTFWAVVAVNNYKKFAKYYKKNCSWLESPFLPLVV